MAHGASQAIREIKSRLSLVDIARRYMDLRQNGPRWVAPCPFHQETKPSFSIHEEEGFFYCFGCQASGDLFDFYSRINGLDFKETLEQLAEEAGVALAPRSQRGAGSGPATSGGSSERRQLLRLHELAAARFVANLGGPEGEECRAYMERRGISQEIITSFGLGWSLRGWRDLCETLRRAGFEDKLGVSAALLGQNAQGRIYDRFRGRLMFPIRSLSGNVIAFGGRIIADEDEAKYINSSDSPLYKKGDHLYGLPQARRAIAAGQPALLTEGYMDVLTLHQFGYLSAVGVLGTALTPEQVKRLSGFTSRVELLFDGDRAGRKAALNACRMFLTRGLRCRVVLFPETEDIDSLLRSQGVEAFEHLRQIAPDGLQFCVQTLRELAPRDAVDWAREFLKQVTLPELLSPFALALANGLGLSETELRDQLVQSRAARTDDAQGRAGRQTPGRSPGQPAGAPGEAGKGISCEREILSFVVRYPHALAVLREAGAKVALAAPWAKTLWDKLERLGPEDDALHQLDAREKTFWIRSRSGAPLTNEQGELDAVLRMLENMQFDVQLNSAQAALRQSGGGDFEADLEYLRALQETLEKTHGEH